MNFQKFAGKSKLLAGALIIVAGLAGWGAARASQSLFYARPAHLHENGRPCRGSQQDRFCAHGKTVLPDVVNISTSKVVKGPSQREMQEGMPDGMPPFFQQFFGQQFGPDPGGRQQQAPRDQRERSLGSGVIVSPDGYILTNNHVIDGATDVRVTLSDKRQLKAQVVGADPKTDIAVLKVEGSGFPPSPLATLPKCKWATTHWPSAIHSASARL